MNQKTKMGYTSQKGITLIALVITIIVLLILAGVTISMVLGEDGIIAQAQQAKKQNEDSSLKDAVSVAKAEAATAKYVKQTPLTLTEAQKTFTTLTDATYKNSVAKVVDGVPIPVGFAYVQGTKVDTGLIVVDGYGNEYVWVPVDEVLESGSADYEDDKVSLINDSNDSSLVYTDEFFELSEEELESDYTDMKASVAAYGGFYVGRYETSWTGTRVASVGGVQPMNGTTPLEPYSNDGDQYLTEGVLGSNWYTFYRKQKELYNKESDSVVSGMIYGSQWDAIADWMSDIENPNAVDPKNNLYINDSTGMGNYLCETNCPECGYHVWFWGEEAECQYCGLIFDTAVTLDDKTGVNENYRVKNVYDLAGNYCEQTCRGEVWCREMRGGWFGTAPSDGFNMIDDWGDIGPSYANWEASSRMQLYIK